MNFQSILIISYARSGSTLLQSILNSHEELLVRGENYNFCYHLFKSYNALKKTKGKSEQLLPKQPFFGYSVIDEKYFINNIAETVKKLLLAEQLENLKIKAYGFKEVRYPGTLDHLLVYLDFLKQIFPNPLFVFNTRNKDDVFKSRLNLCWVQKKDYQKTIERLIRAEALFSEFIKNNPTNSFHISYEEVTTKSDKLKELHNFIGLPYTEAQMVKVLAVPHSVPHTQKQIKQVEPENQSIYRMPKENPLVTVLLCTYNDERYIAETIQSILNQTYQNFEFIILNDGSTDKTKQIIQSFKDSRIRYLEHSENKGLEDSKNWGLTEARGKYIAYIDGDDIAMPERLRTQTLFMEENPKVGLCASAVQVFGAKSNYYFPAETDLQIRGRALFGTPLNHPSCMIRTSVLRKYDIRYRKDFPAAEDHPFMLQLLKVTEAYCFPTVLLKYRWHDQNISVTKKPLQIASAKRAKDLAFKDLAFKELAGIEVTEEEQEVYKDFWLGDYHIRQISTLKNIRNKIQIDADLDFREIEFRSYLKKRLSNTIEELYETLINYAEIFDGKLNQIVQLEKENKQLHLKLNDTLQSMSWKVTHPLRLLGKWLLKLRSDFLNN